MQTINFVIGGLGGQGILFMTKILARTALKKGFNVMGAETHGMAQRGGSVISHLRLGDVESSLVKTGAADFLLALEENEAYRNLPFLAKRGVLCSSRSTGSFPVPTVESYLKKNRITCYSMKAGRIALELNAPMSANLALVGFFATLEKCPFAHQELRETIEALSPEPYQEINLKVFDTGVAHGNKQSASAL
ncbi:MAG: 2-oxoacid:acceptor oxidoreductase family protein [Deltaproteobacteria bacterium]|nr:2-oxoacid:acceptor oxidoreductase family protein [Deltaproteobacteria bacterium]